MILERKVWSNGYGCSCCGQTWESSDFVNKIMPPNKLLKFMKEQNNNMCDDHIVSLKYYEGKDGTLIYGFDSSIYKKGEDNYIVVFGGKKHVGCKEDKHMVFSSMLHTRKKECITQKKALELLKKSLEDYETRISW